MDTTQILLTVILSIVIIFMSVVGYYFVKILQEVNKIIKKAHGVIEGFERMGSGLENGFNDMAGFVGGIKSVFNVLEIFKKRKKSKSDEQSESSTS